MVRDAKFKGNTVILDWDQEDYDYFFIVGLQQLTDDHFKGERKVVVVPITDPVFKSAAWISKHPDITTGTKQVNISDEFADGCVEYGVNHALRQYIDQFDLPKKVSKPKKTVKSKVQK